MAKAIIKQNRVIEAMQDDLTSLLSWQQQMNIDVRSLELTNEPEVVPGRLIID